MAAFVCFHHCSVLPAQSRAAVVWFLVGQIGWSRRISSSFMLLRGAKSSTADILYNMPTLREAL